MIHHQEADLDSPCRNCGEPFAKHMGGLSLGCPGGGWREYEASKAKDGDRYTTLLCRPVCPYCGLEYQYDDADDLHDAEMHLRCGRWDEEDDSNPDKKGCGKRFKVGASCTKRWTTEKGVERSHTETSEG